MNSVHQDKQKTFRITYPRGLIFLVALGLMAYANAVFLPFVHDEIVFIKLNPHIGDFSNLGAFFFQTLSPQTTLANPYYRPLLEIFLKLQYQLFHQQAFGYHLFNILLHIINSWMIFVLMINLGKRHLNLGENDLGFPLSIAVFFLIHPVQTEAVTCISGLSNLMMSALCLISLLLYTKIREQRDLSVVARLSFRGISLFIYASVLFFKEQSIVFPLLLILYELCFSCSEQDSLQTKKRYFYLGNYFLITIAYLIWRKIILGSAVPAIFSYNHELILRLFAIPGTLLMYLRILVFPHDLHYYRSIDILTPVGISPLILVAILGGSYLLIRKMEKEPARLAWFGVGWFFITILPVLNILPLIHEYSFIAAFEHFLYLPVLGFLLFCFVVARHFFERHPQETKNLRITLVSLLTVTCVLLTIKQNTFWRAEIPLFERVVRFEKKLGRVHLLLARAYFLNKQYARAEEEYSLAFAIMNGYVEKVRDVQAKQVYFGFIKETYLGRARIFEVKGDLNEAISQYKKALVLDSNDGVIHNNIGLDYIRMNDIDQAMHHFQQALRINNQDPIAMMNLAIVYVQKENYSEAERLLRKVLVMGDYPGAKANLERLLKSKGKR